MAEGAQVKCPYQFPVEVKMEKPVQCMKDCKEYNKCEYTVHIRVRLCVEVYILECILDIFTGVNAN